MNSLRELAIEVELLDLRDYFGKKDELKEKLEELGAIFVSGGNTFVLRQAMKLSSLDQILPEFKNKDFLYAGYSAAGCVLSSNLRAYQIVDDPSQMPYPAIKGNIWEGLGLIDFAFIPHFQSDHPESKAIDQKIEFCKKNNISFKAVHDGEVIVIE